MSKEEYFHWEQYHSHIDRSSKQNKKNSQPIRANSSTSFVNSSGFFRRKTLPVFSITSRNVRGNSSTLQARNNDAAQILYNFKFTIKNQNFLKSIVYLTSKPLEWIDHVKTMHVNNSCIDTIMWSTNEINEFRENWFAFYLFYTRNCVPNS